MNQKTADTAAEKAAAHDQAAGSSGGSTKVTVNLPNDAMRELRRLAQEQDISMTQVLRNALALEAFIANERAAKSKLLIERPDGQFREVVIR